MGIYTTKPIREVSNVEMKALLDGKELKVSSHTVDHLDQSQRKVYKEEELTQMVEKETPRKIYLQENGRYALFFRKSDGYRKIIIEIEKSKAVIVTFMDPLEIPK